MQIVIQVIHDDGQPASRQYTFGDRLSLPVALMLVQSLVALSGGFEDHQIGQIEIERVSAELAQALTRQTVRIAQAR